MARYRGNSSYIGAWHYVGLEILYSIPVIGWIILVVHCFMPERENRMHFARHYFARLLLALVILVIAALVLYLLFGQQFYDTNIDTAKFWDDIVQVFNNNIPELAGN